MLILMCYTVIKGRPRPLPRAGEQAAAKQTFVFHERLTKTPPAIAGSRAHKRVGLSIGEKPACIIAWA